MYVAVKGGEIAIDQARQAGVVEVGQNLPSTTPIACSPWNAGAIPPSPSCRWRKFANN